MISRFERFWIIFILRLAFGFFFLFAAINIHTAGIDTFVDANSKGFEGTWLADITLSEDVTGMLIIKLFLRGAPYLMAALSVPILTGILAKPALRIGALLLVGFGLGKYVQDYTNLSTTAADFLLAFMICVGLYFMGLKPARGGEEPEEA